MIQWVAKSTARITGLEWKKTLTTSGQFAGANIILAGFQQTMYPELILHYRATDERCAVDKRAGNSFFSSSIKALTLGRTVCVLGHIAEMGVGGA